MTMEHLSYLINSIYSIYTFRNVFFNLIFCSSFVSNVRIMCVSLLTKSLYMQLFSYLMLDFPICIIIR